VTSPGSRCDEIVSLIDECLDEVARPPGTAVRDDRERWDLTGGRAWWLRSVEVFSKPLA